jgi:hypothetical protein
VAGLSGTSFLSYTSILSEESWTSLVQAAKEELDRETLSGPQEKALQDSETDIPRRQRGGPTV